MLLGILINLKLETRFLYWMSLKNCFITMWESLDR